jgi:mannose-1-phosphate guanylyltransferase/mannose-1-phosphate guanylyltransferase/mannose-6-phosphate isomerase
MFVFPAGPMLKELANFEPEIAAGAEAAVKKGERSGEVLLLDHVTFADIPSKSIDYALMEKTALSAVVPASLGWSDVGSWSALWEIGDKDHVDNVLVGDVMAEDTDGSYLRSHGPLIAALGLKDVVIVATGDVVMAASKDRSQDVKRFVNRLKADGRTEHVSHRVVNQAWGSFQDIDSGPSFQVKRITVKPGAALSEEAQSAAHWTVVGGTGRVTRGTEVQTLSAGMSLDIPKGTVHRLENIGTGPLELVAVRFG